MDKVYRFTVLCLLLLTGMARAEIETITYLHNDHLGSPVLARDSQGNTLWREDYSPWGERLTRPSGNSADIGYTGHYEETDIGLTYAMARWYDPQVGRFLATDAVDFTGGGTAHFNRYVYANDNPFRFIDLDGRDSREASRAAAFAAAGDADYNARAINRTQGVSNAVAATGNLIDREASDPVNWMGAGLLKGASGLLHELRILTKSGLKPTQKAVSGPQVDRLAEDMKVNGFDPVYPVKVDGDLVVDGHHRVMAAEKAGVDIVTTPGTATTANKANALSSFEDIKVDPVDWYK